MSSAARAKMLYKSGVTLDQEIAVKMPAGDWLVFLNWIGNNDTDGINYIVYGMMSEQIMAALYSAASIKAAQAHQEEENTSVPPGLLDAIRQAAGGVIFQMGPDGIVPMNMMPPPEDFGYGKDNDE